VSQHGAGLPAIEIEVRGNKVRIPGAFRDRSVVVTSLQPRVEARSMLYTSKTVIADGSEIDTCR
jgi:hypothetical protein